MQETLENVLKYTGGAEEEKEECEFDTLEKLRQDSTESEQEPVGDARGFRAQLEEFSRFFLGGCGNVLEVASSVIRDKTCRWGGASPSASAGGGGPQAQHLHHNNPRQVPHQPYQQQQFVKQPDLVVPPAPALSIADELKRLAAQQPRQPRRAADIPRFLGEDAVYSFEDDNVSAISQHTLEEMARRGPKLTDPRLLHPLCRSNGSHGSNRTPSPGRTRSSTSSSKE